jgi:hypothetical protein
MLAVNAETVGLLAERAPGEIGFAHAVFEEYLAAEHIHRWAFPDITAFVRERSGNPLWRNVISNLVSLLARPTEVESVVAAIETARADARRMQDRATIAWNLATGLYYKTQPLPPWKLSGTRPGVCYIGLVYKNLPNDPNNHACCAAQMFLSEGDGVVFRGANGPWQTGEFEYHLKPEAAKDLIKKVLDTYRDKHDRAPSELFIHGQTSFNDDEWWAFEEAAPRETNVVGVRIWSTDGETKLFRDGDYPVLRGTALILDERNANLWTNGYVPQLDTYIGPETPNPLFITLLRSKHAMPQMETVLKDIVGLTKINYNSCNYNDSLPVTVRFTPAAAPCLPSRSCAEMSVEAFWAFCAAVPACRAGSRRWRSCRWQRECSVLSYRAFRAPRAPGSP